MDEGSEKKNVKSILRLMKYNENAVTYHTTIYYKSKKIGVIDICLASIEGSKRKVLTLQSPFHKMKAKLYSTERSSQLRLELRGRKFEKYKGGRSN